MELINGTEISKQIIEELKQEVSTLNNGKPCIAIIRVGDDPASVSYVKKKEQTAEKIGMRGLLFLFPDDVSKDELFAKIDELNADDSVNGILIQAPLPDHIGQKETFNRVSPAKDVDGLGVVSMGSLVQEDPDAFAPCTPSGLIELLKRSNIEIEGKHVVVLGRSLLVGKSAAMLFVKKGKEGNATVTICHSRTKNLEEITSQADILVAAIGIPEFVKENMVKPGCIVLDVGINRVEDSTRPRGYKLVGDVDFEKVAPKCSHITPVPGGVGPMTVAMLMQNTVKSYKKSQS